MNDQDKSKEELINELRELKQAHNSLKAKLEADLLEIKQTELELKAGEERYRSLVGNLEAGIVVHAPDTSIVLNNLRASELLGLSNDQMRGKAAIDPAWKFINEDSTPLPPEGYPVSRIARGRQPIKNQVLGIHQPGKNEVVWVTVNGFPVLGNSGGITEIVISFIDITERKQSEQLIQEKTEEIEVQNEEYQEINEELNRANQELAEAKEIAEKNEARLKMALEVSRSGAWDWDILKNTFYWSDQFLQLFGLPENTKAGFASWTKALHPEDVERASVKIQEAIENRTELLNDYRIILPNKEIRWIRATGHASYVNNKPVRMIGLCMDISYQKTAEQELYNAKERAEESEAIIKASMENSQAGIAIAECPTGKLKYANKAALLIRGKEYDEIVKDIDLDKYVTSWQILHFDGTPYQTDEVPLTRAIRYGETSSREFIVRRDNNEDRYVWANAAPIYNAHGIQTSAIVTFVDITDRKLAEEAKLKLEEEQRFSIYGLNTAQSLARMGSWKWDIKNDKVWWSDEMYHIFGIDKISYKGLLRNVIKSVIHPDDLHIVLPENASEFAKNEINEYRIIHPDHSIRHIQAKAGQTEFDTEGNPIFLSGIAQDITERKQLEGVHTFLSTSGYPGSDEDFFESLAKYLAKILDSEYVCIDKLEGDGLTAQTVAIYNEGKFEPNVSYTLKQTPCGDVVGKNICCFPENVCQLFPNDEALQDLKAHSYIGTTLWSFEGKPIGLIAIIGQKPLKNAAFAENVLKLVAIRAAGELERMQADAVLRESERTKTELLEKLNDAQHLAKIGSWEWDLKTNQVWWSDEIYQIFGVSPLDFVPGFEANGKFIHPDDFENYVQSFENSFQTGAPLSLEIRLVSSDGLLKHCHAMGKIVSDDTGQPLRFSGSIMDISERKHTEDLLRIKNQKIEAQNENLLRINEELKHSKEKAVESEEKFKSYTQSSPIAIYTTDENGDCIYANGKWLEIAGLTLEESLGKGWIKALHPEDKDLIFENWYKSVQLNGNWSYEYRFITPQGKITYVEGSARPLYNKANKLIGYLGSNVDITQRKQAELGLIDAKEQAEESDRLKSAFLANMSHEIRTPMNGILGFAELLKTPGLSGEEQQQFIKIIEKSGARMLNIINDIVDISKIEAGLMKVEIKESNINEQIEYIYSFFKPEVEAKGMKISFRNSLPAKEAIIKTDREKLYAILTNLVKNAIKYTNEGSIEFGYDIVETDNYPSLNYPSHNYPSLRFFVKDTGIGIPQDRQDAIFERFIQADVTDKMAMQGAGLGLSITKAYVEMLGGKIWVESQKGMGSIFYFTMPYHAEPEIKPIDQQLAPSGKTDHVRKLKILIAEDDEASEMLIDLIVKTFCKELLKVGTGVEAVEACRNNPDIDLVLMDIRMPEMDGYKATKQIREFNQKVVIIAQTAFGLSGDKEKSIESGCNDYISKPINKDELLALIEMYFGN